jgi:bifunctional DNA-binding transcriptional regulator/antitoxin component of YhaV-PrlF toxin-antitoxin module
MVGNIALPPEATGSVTLKRILKVTSKGRVTFRKEMLDQLGVRPGDNIAVEVVGPGRIEVRAARPTADLNVFIGSLKKPGTRPLSIEEINRIIRKSWAGQK